MRVLKTIFISYITAILLVPMTAFATDNSTEGLSEQAIEITGDASTEASSAISEESDMAASEGSSEQTGEYSVSEARNGVLQVNCTYKDDLGKSHIICGGTGFLIGDKEKTEYVITSAHLIAPEKKTRDAAFKAFKVKKDVEWDKIPLDIQVVVENDVVVNASVVKTSEAMDLAVLQLEQPIYTRTPLTILVPDTKNGDRPYDVADRIYTLGYPTEITFEAPVYYSNDKVSMTSGSIANITTRDGVGAIQHDAKIDESNCGGPLINSDGLVIGMNENILDGSNYYSLETAEIIPILDGLGIEYSKLSASDYASLNATVEDIPEPDGVGSEIVYVENKGISPLVLIIVCIVFVLIIGVIVAIGVLMIRKNSTSESTKKEKKKKEKDEVKIDRFGNVHEKKPSGEVKTVINEKPQTNGSETSLLETKSSDVGTSVLAGGGMVIESLGTLIRRKNGEKITINKSEFTIGKDSLNIDFRIVDNSAVSRRHATIKKQGASVIIEDNNSTNGTLVNGRKIGKGQTAIIRNGDVIALANEEFDYRS